MDLQNFPVFFPVNGNLPWRAVRSRLRPPPLTFSIPQKTSNLDRKLMILLSLVWVTVIPCYTLLYPTFTLNMDTMDAIWTPCLRYRKDMASTRVVRKVKVEGKWQFLPVTRVGEKLDWGKLDLHGTPITSIPETFYLDYRENGQRVRRAIGDHPLRQRWLWARNGAFSSFVMPAWWSMTPRNSKSIGPSLAFTGTRDGAITSHCTPSSANCQ
jgi:hypothetical protein